MKLLTAAELRQLDSLAAASAQLPTRVLMESAGAAVARVVLEREPRRVFVFCGPGNNGGDGYVCARFLREALAQDAGGERVLCIATRALDQLKGDAALAARAWVASGGKNAELTPHLRDHLGHADVTLVDAVFGSGLTRPPAGAEAQAIDWMNEASSRGARLVAVDIPSGVDSDTGAVYPSHLAHADETVTFHLGKRGLHLHPGAQSAGRIRVAPIGIPRALEAQLEGPGCELIDEEWARAALPRRPRTAHKNDFGHVLVVAGSPGKSGAAALVVEAALRAGAGLVTLCAREEVLAAALPGIPEAMGVALAGTGPLALADLPALREALKGKTALAMGPGISRGPETGPLIGELLAGLDPSCATVLDADALNALADHRERIGEWLGRAKVRPLLTPHPGEFARLTGEEVERIESDRLEAATRAAQRFSACVVLKGARSVIADPEGSSALCAAGNPGMATAGSGDVLTGIAAALLAHRFGNGGTGERARLAVFLHAFAGDLAAAERGEAGLVASDLIRVGLPRAFVKLGR